MTLARIITTRPERVRDLAADLCVRGFQVEVVHPNAVTKDAADLVLRLEECTPEQAKALAEQFEIGAIRSRHGAATPSENSLGAPSDADAGLPQDGVAMAQTGEESLSDWPLWQPMNGLEENRLPEAAAAAILNTAESTEGPGSKRRWLSGGEPLLAGSLILALLLMAGVMVRRQSHSGPHPLRPTLAASSDSGLPDSQSPRAEQSALQLASLKQSGVVRRVSLRKRDRNDLIATDTVIRLGSRSTPEGPTVVRAGNGASSRRHAESSTLVAPDTVVRYAGR